MKYLIDTQVLIWWFTHNPRLTSNMIEILLCNKIFISDISLWEITIKKHIGKLNFMPDISVIINDLREMKVKVLPLKTSHLIQLQNLELIHRDPFDRMLIAQTQAEKMVLITSDKKIWQYPVAVEKIL